MSHYRSRRAPSSSNTAGPIVAFLMIACFGLLFVTGCSSVRGPDETTEDDTFTAEDIVRFQELNRMNESASGSSMAMASAGTDSVTLTATGASATAGTVDPALRKKYDALRASSTSNGANVYRVTNAFLNVRSEPSVSAAFVTRLDQGELVTLVEFPNASWAKIKLPNGSDGYVSSRYISKLTSEERLKDEQKAFEGLYFVNFAFVNVRNGATTGSDKLGELPGQAFLRPLSIDKGWARIPFEGKEGYVSMEFLAPFTPNFLVRQDTYTLPILQYSVTDDASVTAMTQHVARLKQDGVRFIALRDLFDTVQTQEVRDTRLPPRSAVIAVNGLTAQNAKKVSDALTAAGVPATFFVQSNQVGVSGITEKMLLTLSANGFDIQSAGHMGDDLRTLTNAQTQLELTQSKALLEGMTHKTVFAIAYPLGAANERVLNQAADAGYLFGMGNAPDRTFSREQFLRLPSYSITAGMSADDVLNLTK